MLRIENGKTIFYTLSATKTGLQQLMPDMEFVVVPDKFTNHMRWLYGPGVLQIGGVVTAVAQTGTAKKTGLEVGDRIVDIKAVSGDCIISWGYITNNLQSIDSNPVSDFVAGELVGKPGFVFELTVQKPNQAEPIKIVLECVNIEESYPVFEAYEIYQDSKKSMWFGLGSGSIIYQANNSQNWLDFSDWRFCNEEDNVEKLICPVITESRDGRIWIGSLVKTAGLNVFDPVDSKWASFQLADMGGTDECGSVIQTNDGAIWAGGLGVINIFKNDKWHIYKYPQVPIVTAKLQFLQKAVAVVEKNISDSNFGAKTLADELGMSRAQLYRKIKSVTDQTVNSFIRSLRLQRAAKLLLGRKLTISEVGCEVGLFEPANFTAYFRKQFGQSPTEYIAEHAPQG